MLDARQNNSATPNKFNQKQNKYFVTAEGEMLLDKWSKARFIVVIVLLLLFSWIFLGINQAAHRHKQNVCRINIKILAEVVFHLFMQNRGMSGTSVGQNFLRFFDTVARDVVSTQLATGDNNPRINN